VHIRVGFVPPITAEQRDEVQNRLAQYFGNLSVKRVAKDALGCAVRGDQLNSSLERQIAEELAQVRGVTEVRIGNTHLK